jgi:hypothetical protein
MTKILNEAHYDRALSMLEELVVGGCDNRDKIKELKKAINQYEKQHCPERRACRKKKRKMAISQADNKS